MQMSVFVFNSYFLFQTNHFCLTFDNVYQLDWSSLFLHMVINLIGKFLLIWIQSLISAALLVFVAIMLFCLNLSSTNKNFLFSTAGNAAAAATMAYRSLIMTFNIMYRMAR